MGCHCLLQDLHLAYSNTLPFLCYIFFVSYYLPSTILGVKGAKIKQSLHSRSHNIGREIHVYVDIFVTSY